MENETYLSNFFKPITEYFILSYINKIISLENFEDWKKVKGFIYNRKRGNLLFQIAMPSTQNAILRFWITSALLNCRNSYI